MENGLLERLRTRGNTVSISGGYLCITTASGRPVPPEWLQQHERPLLVAAAKSANAFALEFLDYSVGNYAVDNDGHRRAGGVSLQFRCMTSGQELHAIFNASTCRCRTTKHGKAGDPLPKGQFRVGKRSHFYKFWQSTGLPVHRLSDFHDYMGNLKGLIYTGSITKGERLDAATLRPLTLNTPDNAPTTSRQVPDSIPTRHPDKETPQSQQSHSFQPKQGTCHKHYDNTVIRERGHTDRTIPPELQTNDEWLADYSSG